SVVPAGLLWLGLRQLEHLVGHVDPVCVAAWSDSPRREQDIQAGSRAEVENDLSGYELSQHRRIAAAEADRLGQPDFLQFFSRVRATAATIRSVGLAAAGVRRESPGGNHGDLLGHTCVPGPDRLSNLAHCTLLL